MIRQTIACSVIAALLVTSAPLSQPAFAKAVEDLAAKGIHDFSIRGGATFEGHTDQLAGSSAESDFVMGGQTDLELTADQFDAAASRYTDSPFIFEGERQSAFLAEQTALQTGPGKTSTIAAFQRLAGAMPAVASANTAADPTGKALHAYWNNEAIRKTEVNTGELPAFQTGSIGMQLQTAHQEARLQKPAAGKSSHASTFYELGSGIVLAGIAAKSISGTSIGAAASGILTAAAGKLIAAGAVVAPYLPYAGVLGVLAITAVKLPSLMQRIGVRRGWSDTELKKWTRRAPIILWGAGLTTLGLLGGHFLFGVALPDLVDKALSTEGVAIAVGAIFSKDKLRNIYSGFILPLIYPLKAHQLIVFQEQTYQFIRGCVKRVILEPVELVDGNIHKIKRSYTYKMFSYDEFISDVITLYDYKNVGEQFRDHLDLKRWSLRSRLAATLKALRPHLPGMLISLTGQTAAWMYYHFVSSSSVFLAGTIIGGAILIAWHADKLAEALTREWHWNLAAALSLRRLVFWAWVLGGLFAGLFALGAGSTAMTIAASGTLLAGTIAARDTIFSAINYVVFQFCDEFGIGHWLKGKDYQGIVHDYGFHKVVLKDELNGKTVYHLVPFSKVDKEEGVETAKTNPKHFEKQDEKEKKHHHHEHGESDDNGDDEKE